MGCGQNKENAATGTGNAEAPAGAKESGGGKATTESGKKTDAKIQALSMANEGYAGYTDLKVEDASPRENTPLIALPLESNQDPFKHRADQISCLCMRPTLLVKFPGDEMLSVDPKCAIVLTCLSEKHWDGRWRLSSDEADELLIKIEMRHKRASQLSTLNNKLSLDEIERFVDNLPKDEIQRLPGAVRGLMNKHYLHEVYHEMDPDGDEIDSKEWLEFLTKCAALRFQYLHGVAFNDNRCYWGRGQHFQSGQQPWEAKDGLDLRQFLDKMSREGLYNEKRRFFFFNQLLAIGPDNLTGWKNDLYYFSANNHALHGIIACDPTHRLERAERLAMEITTVFFTVLIHSGGQIGKIAPWTEDIENPFLYKLVVITIPGTLLWYLLFFLYTTPKCGHADESEDSKEKVRRAQLCSDIGDWLGMLISLAVAGFCVYEFMKPDKPGLKIWENVLHSRVYGYIIQWATMICIRFNPIIAVGQPDPKKQGTLSKIGGAIGLGKWSVEKRRFQLRCHKEVASGRRFSLLTKWVEPDEAGKTFLPESDAPRCPCIGNPATQQHTEDA